MATAGLEIYDSKGRKIYDTVNHRSYYLIGEFTVGASLYPDGTSEGHGSVATVLENSNIKVGATLITKKTSTLLCGYSYGHYPANGSDGDGYLDIQVSANKVTAQFKRYPANGTKGYYYWWSAGTFQVWGVRS